MVTRPMSLASDSLILFTGICGTAAGSGFSTSPKVAGVGILSLVSLEEMAIFASNWATFASSAQCRLLASFSCC
uniref:Secreted protein n=1 Tax=Panstrongylus lignarius TaxID=156445 RepID=A0A224Y5F6_9HEMI